MIEQIVNFAPGNPETLQVKTATLRVLEIDGVKYSAEVFRTFVFPDPNQFYQFARLEDDVIVNDRGGDVRGLVGAARALIRACDKFNEENGTKGREEYCELKRKLEVFNGTAEPKA